MTAPSPSPSPVSDPLFAGYVVDAYAASPALRQWDPAAEEAYYAALAADPRVAALELPWIGGLHPHDDEWLVAHLPDRLGAVFTDIPWTVQRGGADPAFGLASSDAAGRAAARETAGRMRDGIRRLHDRLGRRAVRAVELHSAPRATHGDAASLAASLAEVAAWDWDGAHLVIEHCDAWSPEHPVEKGYLPLDDEIAAIRDAGVDVGVAINWGRSAIETRDADAVAGQIARAAESGLLRGLMLSGASDADGEVGGAWVDAHHPFRRSPEHPHGDPVSLLTEERATAAAHAAGCLEWAGVKVAWPSGRPGSPAERARMVADALDACDRAGLRPTP
jgi:hypothetical protein